MIVHKAAGTEITGAIPITGSARQSSLLEAVAGEAEASLDRVWNIAQQQNTQR